MDMNEKMASKTMTINAESHIWTVREVLPDMYERNSGHIVSIASLAGLIALPAMSDYSASKAADKLFNEGVRLEMKQLKKNIRVTTISPFFINTGMFEGVKCSLLFPLLR